MENREKMCRFCFEKYDTDFKVIERRTLDLLNIPLVTKNLAISDEHVACKNCEEVLIKCSDFKATCLRTYSYIVQCLDRDHIQMNLRDVYLSRNGIASGVPAEQNVCAFCMSLVEKCSAVSLDVEEGNAILEEMIKQCLPELDLNIIKTPVICVSCRGSLENCFHLVTNCLDVSEKIKNCCEAPDVNSKDQVELTSRSLGFTIGDTVREVDGNLADVIKVEEEFYDDRKSSYDIKVGNEGGKFKLEQCVLDIMDCQNVNNEQQFTPKNIDTGESNKLDSIKVEQIFFEGNESKPNGEHLVEMEDQEFLFNDEIEIKTDEHDFSRLEDGVVFQRPEVAISLTSNLEADQPEPHIKQTFTNEKVSPTTMYHRRFCQFGTKYRRNHTIHLLKHKNPSKVTIHKCDFCSYQTIYRGNLKNHLLQHQEPSEVTMYRCGSCPFQTKHKGNLKYHLLMHTDPSEISMYRCGTCSFQTKHKGNLKHHLLTHKDPSEVTMYKCESCSFQTKRKQHLKNHLLKHKDPSEVTMYKCDSCSFQTQQKNYLRIHQIVHKSPSEATMHKCDSCSFQAKNKRYLKSHLILHKNSADLTMYKCDSCSYQTKHKRNLGCHVRTHKNPSELTMYKCDSCSFQTERKNSLKIHLLAHKDPSGVTMPVA